MGSYPKTEIDARARSRRKLKALQRRAFDLLAGADGLAGLWEEGPVSSDVDQLLADIKSGVEAIMESMDGEIARHVEEEDI